MERRRVLFVCTHNSARSQMAEGMLNAWGPRRFEAHSAGTEATELRPEAVAVMAEIGIDISKQQSKTIDEFRDQPIDAFITVCDTARQSCPVLPGVSHVEHWSIGDPSAVTGGIAQRLEAFRRARDELAARVRAYVARS